MDSTIITALLGFAGSFLAAFGGILINTKLTTYRIEQLEKKVEKHNSVIERTFRLEEDIEHINHEVDDIRNDIRSKHS